LFSPSENAILSFSLDIYLIADVIDNFITHLVNCKYYLSVEPRAAAQRKAHPPPEAKRGGTTSGAVGGRVQRLVLLRLIT
jgi:hypothetical protein